MDIEAMLKRLGQIREQAQRTLAEYPKTTYKERQRMIVALVKKLEDELLLEDEHLDETLPGTEKAATEAGAVV